MQLPGTQFCDLANLYQIALNFYNNSMYYTTTKNDKREILDSAMGASHDFMCILIPHV